MALPLAQAALRDRRSYRVDLELQRDGTGRVEGTIELQGMEAAAWRDVLRNLDRDRINDGFGQPTVAFTFCSFWMIEALALLDPLLPA